MQIALAQAVLQICRQISTRQRPCRHDNQRIILQQLIKAFDLLIYYLYVGMAAHHLGHHTGKSITVNCQCTTGRHTAGIGTAHNQRALTAHFLFQQTDSIGQPGRPQRITAHQLGKMRSFMHRRCYLRAHLEKTHPTAHLCRLPRCLRACQTGADNIDKFAAAPSGSVSTLCHPFCSLTLLFA